MNISLIVPNNKKKHSLLLCFICLEIYYLTVTYFWSRNQIEKYILRSRLLIMLGNRSTCFRVFWITCTSVATWMTIWLLKGHGLCATQKSCYINTRYLRIVQAWNICAAFVIASGCVLFLHIFFHNAFPLHHYLSLRITSVPW